MSRRKQAEKIKLDVINWSKTVLEPMNKHIGFPACPFAAKWRKDKKVRIEVRIDKSKYEKQLTSVIKSWNKKEHDIIIYCDPFFEQYSQQNRHALGALQMGPFQPSPAQPFRSVSYDVM